MFQHAVFDYRRVDYHGWLFINRIVHWFSEDPMISSGHRDKMPLPLLSKNPNNYIIYGDGPKPIIL